MFKDALRSAWAEINLDYLRYNISQIRAKLEKYTGIIGVVKADAYGHGAVEISRVLLANGVKTLAVAVLPEAISLREAGFTCPIIMLGLTPTLYVDTLVTYDITPVTASYENALAISKASERAGKTTSVLIAIDTGMGRVGLLPQESSIAEIQKIDGLSNVRIKGVFSHLATADESDKTYAKEQIEKFEDFYEKLQMADIEIGFKTLANSAAIMELPLCHFDAVRPGIILYGGYPSSEVDKKELSIKPVMSIKATIIQLKKVPAGTSISYGRLFTTARESLIGTIALGYADGYPRSLNGKGRVIINGVYAPVVGNICMDQCMIDVTDVPNVQDGDEVIVMGSDGNLSILADEIAEKTNTVNYEVICAFGQRLPKVYISTEV
ncbi:MAG: alanine racemase [Anaerovorax sp.]